MNTENIKHFGDCPKRGKSALTRILTLFARQLGKKPIKMLPFVLITTLALTASASAEDHIEYRKPQIAAGSTSAASSLISIRDPGEVPQCPNQGPVVLTPCAMDETLVLFDQPVYDNEGLFVICLEKRPYCVPSSLEPEGDKPHGVDGMTMRAMLSRFKCGGYTPPQTLLDLALRTRTTDPLADTTITCNDSTNICTCLSDKDGDCEAKLKSICGSAESFGSNGGVGKDCPTVEEE